MESTKILICEDESLIAAELSKRLAKLGYSVAGIASNASEAISIAKSSKPDLALMDISLDGATPGTELAGIIQRDYGIPSIYLTGHVEHEWIAQADATDPIGYLVKPVEDHELALTIRYGLAQHQTQKKLQQKLSEVTQRANTGQKILSSFRSALASEARMDGLRDIIGGIADHYGNSILALSLPLDILCEGGTLKPFELGLVKRVMSRLAMERQFLKRLHWAAGQGGLTLAVDSAADAFIAICSRFRASLPDSIHFETEIAEGALEFFFDRPALEHAVLSLLDNAREAVNGSGTIRLKAQPTTLEPDKLGSSSAQPGQYLEVTVADSGKGISKENISHVAEPFFTTHVERVATGLGLTAAYGIAKAHGGWLKISSLLDAGTSASLFIPWASQDEKGELRRFNESKSSPSDGFIFSTSVSPNTLPPKPQTSTKPDSRMHGYL